LFVEVLLKVTADDDVHGRGLTDLVLVQAAILVCFKDERANLSHQAKLFICESDEIDGLCREAIDGTKSYAANAL